MQTLFQDLRYGARILLKKLGFTLIVLFMLTLGAAPVSGQGKARSATTLQTKVRQSVLIERLEKNIPQMMKDDDVPGLAVAIVRNGKLVWHRGFGVKSANEPHHGAPCAEPYNGLSELAQRRVEDLF